MKVDLVDSLHAIADGRNATPFDVLGMHPTDDVVDRGMTIRAWLPEASTAEVLWKGRSAPMSRVHPKGVYEVVVPEPEPVTYRLRVDGGAPFEDPYRFSPVFDDDELAPIREVDGRPHRVLGAHVMEHEGVSGTVFAVWAPGARAVSLVGDFNGWRAGRHPMRARASTGVWELFVPDLAAGELYKYRILSHVEGKVLLKTDPYARSMQLRPETASVVVAPSTHVWTDGPWTAERAERQADGRPISVYEVHLGSWKREPGARPRDGAPGWQGYRALAAELIPYVKRLGFTHLELLPVTEHPYDASWGYQTVGYFAPTARYGTPDDLRYFVDEAHRAGLGVILDWVPAHFPRDAHGLGVFDGTHLYEHADPRKGVHPDWGTYIFNYARPEVTAFLISSALYWIEEFHIDGLRLDAVASMLYLDYSRDEGQWVPNQYGGRENLEASRFLRQLNETVHREHPGVLVMAEESTAWPGVTHPVTAGGLGFDVKWNMGWMHDTLEVIQSDPLFRKGVYDKLTFGITYAFSERFLLAFSHDEVVHLKGSMLTKMPGQVLDQFANLRLLYGYMWAHPGKKLLFMGAELAVWQEWDVEGELDWAVAKEPLHAGIQRWITELNHFYAREPALHESDWDGRGFEWLDCHDQARTTLSFLRWSGEWKDHVAVACNFTPVTWEGYRLAVPHAGSYEVVLSSDDRRFGGSGSVEHTVFGTVEGELFGRDQFVELTLPPLSMLFLKQVAPPVDARGSSKPSRAGRARKGGDTGG
jgi:1,4-alpha-glucan branching enzyme